jgi:hypothetical protein
MSTLSTGIFSEFENVEIRKFKNDIEGSCSHRLAYARTGCKTAKPAGKAGRLLCCTNTKAID